MTPPPPFTPDQQRTLALVLDVIIPPDPARGLPGAGEVGVGAQVERALGSLPDMRAMVEQGLADVEAQSQERHGRPFAALAADERAALLAEHGFVFALTLQAYGGYYQQERVLSALGLEPRPPHPAGHPMAPSDLSLLDPVRARGKRWREC
jgi:hypothetical protein